MFQSLTNSYSDSVYTRLANEGIPLRAIARATKTHSDVVREHLRDALAIGSILEIPREEWPAGVTHGIREPSHIDLLRSDETMLLLCIMRCFEVSGLQATLLLHLIKRVQVTRDSLHQAVEKRRSPSGESITPTDQKIVDVVVCHLRKKLVSLGFGPQQLDPKERGKKVIETIWSKGYCVPLEYRNKAFAMLEAFINPTVKAALPVV